MKNYKDFSREYIGSSDIASLVMVGCKDNVGAVAELLRFGKDGDYSAYVCEGEVSIGDHYELVAEFNTWLKIYDDEKLIRKFKGRAIRIYRAGQEGVIVNILDKKVDEISDN